MTMNDEGPQDYEREYTDPLSDVTRVRLGYSHDRGEVTRFVVQLEYCVESEWREVVRYDHDPASEFGHDVTEEGLHIDVYRDGEQYRTEYVAPPMPAGLALDRAEDHLSNNLEGFTTRFEQWHGIRTQ
jgi:hypothetical protein